MPNALIAFTMVETVHLCVNIDEGWWRAAFNLIQCEVILVRMLSVASRPSTLYASQAMQVPLDYAR